MKKLLIVIVLIIVLVAIGFSLRNELNNEKHSTLTLYGNVDIRQVSLAFEGSGRLSSVTVEEGEQIKAGQILARLDTTALEWQKKEIEARLDGQNETLRKLRNGARPQEIAQAKSRVAASQAEEKRAEQDWQRLTRLAKNTHGQAVSAQDLDLAKSTWQVAKAKVAEAQEGLRLMQEGSREEDVAAAQAQVRALEAQQALLKHQIEEGTLKAPVDAVIRSRLLERGDMATPQKPVFALALTTPKWIRVYVNEKDLGRIKPGMNAQVYTDTNPQDEILGSIGYISSVAEFTPKTVQTEDLRTSLVYEVCVIVQDNDNALRLGQPVTVKFPDAPKREEN